jgi:hypothetical protein
MEAFNKHSISFFAHHWQLRIMPSRNVLLATVVGPKCLLRDSLTSLLGGYSYRVTASHHTAADIPSPPGGRSAVGAAHRARGGCRGDRVRRHQTDVTELQDRRPSGGNSGRGFSEACAFASLDVSQYVLTRALDLVMSGIWPTIAVSSRPTPSADTPNSTSSSEVLGLSGKRPVGFMPGARSSPWRILRRTRGAKRPERRRSSSRSPAPYSTSTTLHVPARFRFQLVA